MPRPPPGWKPQLSAAASRSAAPPWAAGGGGSGHGVGAVRPQGGERPGAALGWGPARPRFSTDVRHGDRGRCCARAASVEKGRGTGSGSWWMPPVGARGRSPYPCPMASPLSIGIELQPAGVDRRWVRLWLLNCSGAPSTRCRLVVPSGGVSQ